MLAFFIAAVLWTAVIAAARWCIDKITKKSENPSITRDVSRLNGNG